MISPKIIVFVTCLFVVVLLCSYFYLVVIKLVNIGVNRKKQLWLHQHQMEIEAYLLHGDLNQVSFVPQKAYQFRALEDFFSHYLTNYKIDQNENLVKKFVERYFLSEYRKNLFASSWSVRMNTLYFLDLFQFEVLTEDLLKRLACKNLTSEEEYQIYILLASLEYEHLYELFKLSKGLPPFLLNVMLNRMVNEDNIGEYIAHFQDLHPSWQIGLLDVIRNKNFRSWEVIKFLESLLTAEIRELRIRALKTIAHIGYVSSFNIMIVWFETNSQREDWLSTDSIGERLMVARVMGMIKDERFLPFLEQLIADQKYIVRAEAAKSIRKYKNGKERLLRIVHYHSDLYSRNIAMEWLERSIEND